MATASPTITFDPTTDTGFRMWASTISGQFSAMGLVQAADKGQANWTSTARGTDGQMTSGQYTLTSASAPFSPGDVGKSITVTGAGSSGGNLTTTISQYNSSTQVALNNYAQTTVSAATFSTLSIRSGAQGTNYEIWGFNDTLQATYPVLFKIEYGNQYSSGYWGIAATVGFATDGYGNFTGNTSGRVGMYQSSPYSTVATSAQCYFSGATNRFAMALVAGTSTPSNAGIFLSVERTKDATGADTNTGAILLMVSGAGLNPWLHPLCSPYYESAIVAYTPASGNMPNPERYLPCILSSAVSGSSVYGTTVGASPVVPIAGGPQNPGINQMVGLAADYTTGASYTVETYGTDHTYLQIGPNFTWTGLGGISNPSLATRMLMLFE